MTFHRRAPRAVASALSPLSAEWVPETLLAEVQRAWPEAVGAAIALEARPVGERAGTVTVACSASVWAQELDLMGPDIVARLNERLRRGSISRLRCVSGA